MRSSPPSVSRDTLKKILKRKKWHSHLLIVLLAFSILMSGIFYIVRYRFNRVLKYVVEQESNGKYAFQADKMEISLWHKRILMNKASLIFLDTAHAAAHYDIYIPEIYFSIASWRELLLNKKLIIDSFSVIRPDLKIFALKKPAAKTVAAFHPADILTYLEQTLEHLNARSLSIQNASFTYNNLSGSPPIHGREINFSLSNFTHVNNEDSHILGSDNVEFSLGSQDWILPGGDQELSFKSLSFKSKSQKIEIDSFRFHQNAVAGKGVMDIRADKFFFNSKHLPAIYQKSELLIDTLYCLRPVFSIPEGRKTKPRQAITTAVTARAPIFRKINIKFIDIINGELIQTDKDGIGRNTITAKTNLNVFNLTLDPDKKPELSTDSIKMNVKNIRFFSADSLFQLDIDEFAFNKNDVIFKNVLFAPSAYNHTGKSITFKAPSLILRDIDMEELMQKRLQASSAELIRPEISLRGKEKGVMATDKRSSAEKISALYQTLHGLPQLINVPDFWVSDGNLKFVSGTQLTVKAEGINAHLLPNKFFLSDSLVDIKHAIPDLRISRLNVKAKNLHALVNDFVFDGTRRYNRIAHLQLSLANGTEIKGKGFFWHAFDWDIYQKNKNIQIDLMNIAEIDVHIKNRTVPKTTGKELPAIHIAGLNLGKARILLESTGRSTAFELDNSSLRNLQSTKQFFMWDRAKVNVVNLSHRVPGINATIGLIFYDNEEESRIEQLKIASETERGHIELTVPSVKMNANIRNSHFKSIALQSLVVDQAGLDWFSKESLPAIRAPFNMPINLALSNLVINHLDLHLEKQKDRLSLIGSAKLLAKNIQTYKDSLKAFQYESIDLGLFNLKANRSNLGVNLPEASISLSNGEVVRREDHKIGWKSAVDLSWKDAGVRFLKDSTEITTDQVSGSFKDPDWRLDAGQKIHWQQLAGKTRVSGKSFYYKGKKTGVTIRRYDWNGLYPSLELTHFEVMPNLNREAAFQIAKWQNDYMEVKGEKLMVSRIIFPRSSDDSLVHIGKMQVDGVTLNTYRDRRIPFRHGIEKPMPTQLISTIPLPLLIDTIALQNNQVNVHEYSLGTGLWSDIPLENISGYVTHISSRNNKKDFLSLQVSALIFKNPIRRFTYRESYGDSLSSFNASALLTQTDLTAFTQLSMAMAFVSIERGRADTIAAVWDGNKYATLGDMHFRFRGLKIKVHNKKDSTRWGLMPALKTGIANLVLPNNRNKTGLLFVERDREKFIFNYWVKAQTQGFLSSIGLKSSRKYLRQYNRTAAQYSLPVIRHRKKTKT